MSNDVFRNSEIFTLVRIIRNTVNFHFSPFYFSWPIYSYHHRNGVYVSCISAFIKTMGKQRCVAFDCSNVPGEGMSLFKFPNDLALWAEWTRQVQRTRADFKGPTKNSFACSEHFTKDCFKKDIELAASFGIKKQQRLIKGVIPMIFKRPETFTKSKSQSPLGGSLSLKWAVASHNKDDKPKKKRGAYEKREISSKQLAR